MGVKQFYALQVQNHFTDAELVALLFMWVVCVLVYIILLVPWQGRSYIYAKT